MELMAALIEKTARVLYTLTTPLFTIRFGPSFFYSSTLTILK